MNPKTLVFGPLRSTDDEILIAAQNELRRLGRAYEDSPLALTTRRLTRLRRPSQKLPLELPGDLRVQMKELLRPRVDEGHGWDLSVRAVFVWTEEFERILRLEETVEKHTAKLAQQQRIADLERSRKWVKDQKEKNR